MTIRQKSASAILVLMVLFVLSAFGLLAFRKGTFDVLAVLCGVILSVFCVFEYNMLKLAFKHIDRFVLLAAMFLWCMGLIVLYRMNPETAVKQFVMLLAGTIGMIITMIFIRRSGDFGKWNWIFMVVTLALLASTLVFSRSVYGAKNWLDLGFFTFQPSELAKILFIVVSSYFLATRSTIRSFVPYMCFTAGCVIMLVVARDLGAGLLFCGTFLIMFYTATGRIWLTLAGLGVLGVGAVGSYHLFSHVKLRVEVWQDPWSRYNNEGYQIVQGLIALASGGLLGTGLGLGMPQKIPASHTDYIFAVISEEFGLIVSIAIMIFYLVFIVRGIIIALNARSTFDALLVFGCTAMLALQSFIIIAGVIKLIPLTGITLPFISYGGSSILSSMIMLGVIQGVAVKNGKADEKQLEFMGGRME